MPVVDYRLNFEIVNESVEVLTYDGVHLNIEFKAKGANLSKPLLRELQRKTMLNYHVKKSIIEFLNKQEQTLVYDLKKLNIDLNKNNSIKLSYFSKNIFFVSLKLSERDLSFKEALEIAKELEVREV